MSQIEPGSTLWPYHTHYLNEEWVLVLRGEPTLRTPEGEHVLEEGDIVCFPRGKNGAHQISNRTDSPVRVLMLSSMIRGEIIEYLDTGKVLAKGVDDEDVAAGESIVVAGAVERHARYGWQFSVESFRSRLPQTAEGVALWLRRRVPGIGPTLACAIVEHFGAEHVFAELDRDPERLREVRTKAGRAISRRAMERAVEAWREVAAIREV